MNVAQSILNTPDRTSKERRDMAELRNVGVIDWKNGVEVCHFSDDSALMMVFNEDLCPVEFLAIPSQDQEEAFEHAKQCLASYSGWDEETISHNIESNFPGLNLDVCDEIAAMAIKAAQQKKLIVSQLKLTTIRG